MFTGTDHSAPLLRKQLLAIIADHLLPPLRSGSAPAIFRVDVPFNPPPEVHFVPLDFPPLRPEDAVSQFPDGNMWEDIQMHYLPVPSLRCVVEGEVYHRFGITESMAKLGPTDQAHIGGYGFHIPRNVYSIVPANVPVNTGNIPPWDTPEPPRTVLEHIQLRFLPTGLLCNLNTNRHGSYEIGYSLLIQDPAINQSFQILDTESREFQPSPEILRSQLLTLFLLLQRNLQREIPAMTDGLYSRFPDPSPNSVPMVAPDHPTLAAFHRYVILHLHEEITPEALAKVVAISPGQLNRLVKSHLGTSTMKYVRARRMETAKLLLSRSKMPVSEVSRLVGYSDLPHFSRDFKSDVGQAPLRYRQARHAEQVHP